MARTPLMAGNWKMNLDHQQATHFVQKLAWTLEDAKHDYESVEVAVLPPFTDIRSAQALVVAYEPVWAIGTGEVATPQDAQEVCAAIRATLGDLYGVARADATRVLYGGSVKAGNVAGIMAQPDIDGALVGGASIDPAEFAS